MKSILASTLVLSALVLGGCAGLAQRDQARMAAVEAAAGKPVDSFSYGIHTMYSWQPLDDHQLLVYTSPRRAWLLGLDLCTELPYATSIGITSHTGRVSRLIDSVLVDGQLRPCIIESIRPLDVAKLKALAHQRAGAKLVPAKTTR